MNLIINYSQNSTKHQYCSEISGRVRHRSHNAPLDVQSASGTWDRNEEACCRVVRLLLGRLSGQKPEQ